MQQIHFQRQAVHVRIIKNIAQPFIALFLCLYLGLILPAHHHSDGKTHDDCTLCVVQHQPVKAEAVFVPPAVIVSETVVLFPFVKFRAPSFVSAYRTRAPPVSV